MTSNNTGTVEIQGGSIVFGQSFTNSATSLLKGNGKLSGALQNAGTVAPGNSPGLLTIDGPFTQTSTGLLQIEIGGTTRGSQYDALVVTGAATLGGKLSVSFVNGFTPTAGTQFDILDWASMTGTFATIDLPPLSSGMSWNTTQLYTSGMLTAVPEPASALLLTTASLLVGMASRRKRAASRMSC